MRMNSADGTRRGRPPTDPIDQLRTRLWFHAVKLRSGLPSAYAIELALEPGREGEAQPSERRARKWDRYRDGDRVPDDRPGKPNAVELAEREFPGTARWFRSPVWESFKGARPPKDQLIRSLNELDAPVTGLLFEDVQVHDWTERRLRTLDVDLSIQIRDLNSFAALEAVCLLFALSETIASIDLRSAVFTLYRNMQRGLTETAELEPFFPELFDEVDALGKQWAFATQSWRLDVFLSLVGEPA